MALSLFIRFSWLKYFYGRSCYMLKTFRDHNETLTNLLKVKLQRTKLYSSKFAYLPRQCRPRRYCRHNETLSKAHHHPQHSRTGCAMRACRRRAFASRHTCQSSRISIAHKYRGDINIELRSLPRFLAIYSAAKNKGIPLRNGLFN